VSYEGMGCSISQAAGQRALRAGARPALAERWTGTPPFVELMPAGPGRADESGSRRVAFAGWRSTRPGEVRTAAWMAFKDAAARAADPVGATSGAASVPRVMARMNNFGGRHDRADEAAPRDIEEALKDVVDPEWASTCRPGPDLRLHVDDDNVATWT